MHFNRLRLIGFKSFVDPTDVTVQTGLTGIVGPNGCGKSNLVEALRWVMGESSARQMRGREMDDLIFAGSASRPQRNHAEVQLMLDNGARTAPMVFNDSAEIEVSRRIDRGSGSTYRINGRETRAKDVQLLFADEATGARSTAMVGQGEIGALISAKPAQRRSLLEEAAGVTGLHSRRHEAELRLRAAETNLERLDDVMGALETQLQGLKRQTRQATRYRRIGERIRAAEALLFGRRWASTEAAVSAAEQALTEARREVDGRTQEVAAASAAQATAAATLPPLREDEAAVGGALHRLEVAQVELEAEERRLADAQRSLESRLAQIDADVERENELSHDAAEATTQLAAERAAVNAEREGEDEAESIAAMARDEATERVSDLEAEIDALTRHLAAGEARRGALNREIDDLTVRIGRLAVQAAEVESQRAELAAQSEQTAVLEDAEAAVATAQAKVETLRARIAEAETRRVDSQAAVGAVRDTQQAAETTHAALVAEQAALTELLGSGDNDEWSALIDQINVEAGMETALSAALGDDLAASSDTKAPLHWRGLDSAGEPPPLPKGATALADAVTAPPALARRLSQIGVVADDDGPRLQSQLAQGQRLVSRNGGLWRWDGLTAAADAATQTATRLRQRNRLKALESELKASEKRRAGATSEIEAARAAVVAATDQESAARHALRHGEDVLAGARDARAKAATTAAADASRLASLSETAGRLTGDLDEAKQQLQTAEEARIALPPDTDGRAELDGLRGRLTEGRGELAESINAYERLRREAAARGDRLTKIAADLESWQARADGATARLAQLADRRVTAGAELDSLSDRPAEIATLRDDLMSRLEATQTTRAKAADAVATAEGELATLDQRLRQVEAALAEQREARVRCESALEQANQHQLDTARTITERLDCAPPALAKIAGLKEGEDWPAEHDIEIRVGRLIRERDNMGPVNLRAEDEAQEIDEQLSALVDERTDLEAAIARLRQGIGRLNREGRERLEKAFENIDSHFGSLFTRLFGGGKAHLAMVGSDDPLEAGLEVMASPPGKRLQVLSLLSGGEQALTATALLFAVFLTNPAPICVLDEVDAPLDDANVSRYCDLLEDLARGSNTRFLIITHHRMTMARMDRLFGVTMGERGVSQLVSVNLRTAEGLQAAE